ncbi:hypothetical protein GBZ26_28690, partial [Azospirillum formosense]|nr:hypothetical protein [Azospirillum formosense]
MRDAGHDGILFDTMCVSCAFLRPGAARRKSVGRAQHAATSTPQQAQGLEAMRAVAFSQSLPIDAPDALIDVERP